MSSRSWHYGVELSRVDPQDSRAMWAKVTGRITVGPGPPERPGGPRETSVLRGFKGACKRPPEIAR